MNEEAINAHKLLEQAGIRVSPVRILVIKALAGAGRPLSSLDIEEILETVDRSSITRTLVIFTDKGVVHSFEDGSGSMKYELCMMSLKGDGHKHCHDNYESDEHPHFHCVKCGKTFCLNDAPIPHVSLPEGYRPIAATYIIKGVCADCAQ